MQFEIMFVDDKFFGIALFNARQSQAFSRRARAPAHTPDTHTSEINALINHILF